MTPLRSWMIGLAALSLAACEIAVPNLNPFADNVPPPPCTPVSILADAATQTHFKDGQGRDLLDVEYEADITAIQSLCEYDLEDDGSGILTVQTKPIIEIKRGPANASGTAQMTYFVALTTADRQPMSREDFPVRVTFPGNMTTVTWTDSEPVTLTIPLKSGQTGPDFHIFIGLQINADELQFNRKKNANQR